MAKPTTTKKAAAAKKSAAPKKNSAAGKAKAPKPKPGRLSSTDTIFGDPETGAIPTALDESEAGEQE